MGKLTNKFQECDSKSSRLYRLFSLQRYIDTSKEGSKVTDSRKRSLVISGKEMDILMLIDRFMLIDINSSLSNYEDTPSSDLHCSYSVSKAT